MNTEQALLTSPAIAALEAELQAGNQDALDCFWHMLEEKGTPLIEPIPGDDDHVLITFVCRGDETVENIVLYGSAIGWDRAENRMQQLPGTDLWYKTCIKQSVLRFTYYLSVNDPDTDDYMELQKNWRPDPLNPNVLHFSKKLDSEDDFELRASFVIHQYDAPSPLLQPQAGVPQGTLTPHKFKSELWQNERTILVYTPPGYQADGDAYPLLITTDGFSYTGAIPTPTILDNLTHEGKLAPHVAVFIPSNDNRPIELPCNDTFAEFLAEEVLPWVRENWHVTTDPSQTIVAGSSFGGLAAAFVAFKHPELFGNVLSQSGSFWCGPNREQTPWLIERYAAAEKLPVRFYQDIGADENDMMRDSNRRMRDVLQSKGYDVHYAEFVGGHDYVCWRETMIDGLLCLGGKNGAC